MMERLTKAHYKASDGHYLVCSEMCEREDCTAECGHFDEAIERLAAYEDTGLTPEEIKSMKDEHFSGLEMAKLHSALMELKKYQKADKDGRLVVLPCKVGDKLFRVFAGEIFEHRVGSMKYFAIQGQWDIETYPFCPCVESSIGKTIFLTREEAERALEGRR